MRIRDDIGSTLTTRLREVLAERPATESELRTLAEEADAWRRALAAQISASERRVEELSADPAASLAPIASELQRIEALRPELVEVTSLHEELWNEGEKVAPTSHPKLLRATRQPVDGEWLEEELAELEGMVERGETLGVVAKLAAMIREPRRVDTAVLEDTLH